MFIVNKTQDCISDFAFSLLSEKMILGGYTYGAKSTPLWNWIPGDMCAPGLRLDILWNAKFWKQLNLSLRDNKAPDKNLMNLETYFILEKVHN